MFDAWARIVKEEGVTALWTGCLPTIGRAMVVNVCQLSTQTQAKEEIYKRFKSMYIFRFRARNIFEIPSQILGKQAQIMPISSAKFKR